MNQFVLNVKLIKIEYQLTRNFAWNAMNQNYFKKMFFFKLGPKISKIFGHNFSGELNNR